MLESSTFPLKIKLDSHFPQNLPSPGEIGTMSTPMFTLQYQVFTARQKDFFSASFLRSNKERRSVCARAEAHSAKIYENVQL